MGLGMLHLKKLNTILHSNYFFLLLFGFALFYIFISFSTFSSCYLGKEQKFQGMVLSKKKNGNQFTFEIKAKEKLIIYYLVSNQQDIKEIDSIQVGDEIRVGGDLERPSKNRNFHLFNYQNYLKGKQIFWIVKANNLIKVKNAKGIYVLKNQIIHRIKKQNNEPYLLAFLLGDSSGLEWKGNYQELGISHLFAISGMHIMFITSFLFKICSYLFDKKKTSFLIVVLILTFYILLLYESPSAFRAYFLFILSYLNRHYKWGYSTLQLLFFVAIFSILKNPFVLLQIGFQYSFIICFFLVAQNRKPSSSYIKNLFQTSLLASLVSFPLSVYHFHQFHFGAVLFNMIAVPFVSLLLFPLSFLSFFFPFLNPILGMSISFFHIFIQIFQWFSFLNLTFMAIPSYYLIVYYGCLIASFLKSKTWILLFLLLMFIHFLMPYIDHHYWIDMIDIGQGDAVLIRFPHLSQTVLVDTGGIVSYGQNEQKKRSSQVDHILIPYFRALGVKKIDVLILTHGDQDHMGNAIELVEKFPIFQVLMNHGKNNNLEQNLMKILKQYNIPIIENHVPIIKFWDQSFQFLNTENVENENEDSLIFYTKWNKWNILFMGDAGNISEKRIIEEYKLPKMDILKVGHHGSKNSSSDSFLNIIQPSIALISAGNYNAFGHPHQETIQRFSKYGSRMFVTKQHGSIQIQLGKQMMIRTCLP